MANYFASRLYDFLLFPFLHNTRKKTAQLVTQLNPQSVIDICCGTGNQLSYLHNKNIELTGIDNSEKMLKQSKNIKCHFQDARNIDFSDNTFDLAMIQLALHEKPFEDQIKIINEAYRIIKPNGHLLILDYEISQKTNKSSKYIIYIIEYIAGKDHFRNFKQFHKNNCTNSLINNDKFYLEKQELIAGNSMSLRLYRKKIK